ncbi:MAG: hypothetical protein Q8N94_03280 [Methanoregula sp.]|nr:hypothetical protein [Methanoregula sp.]
MAHYSNRMKFSLCFALILVLCIVSCGCTQQAVAPPAATTPAPVAATVTTIPAAGSDLAKLSDAQPNATVTLDPGVVLVAFQADGPQKMMFSYLYGNDWGAYSDIHITSPFNGTLAFEVPAKGDCVFNISGSGGWTAQVRLPEKTTPLKVPVNMSGSGTDVTPYFTLEKGQYIFQRGETGAASPGYELRFANGSYLMDADNTFVQPGFGMLSPEPFRFIEVTETGTYFLSVIARSNPSPWNASIIGSPAIPHMGPGPAIPGKV